jgi:hypothetical protein
MSAVIRKFFSAMPLLFGIGFIAPLLAQTMTAWNLAPPLDLDPRLVGLAIGGAWGLYATIRGRWL